MLIDENAVWRVDLGTFKVVQLQNFSISNIERRQARGSHSFHAASPERDAAPAMHRASGRPVHGKCPSAIDKLATNRPTQMPMRNWKIAYTQRLRAQLTVDNG